MYSLGHRRVRHSTCEKRHRIDSVYDYRQEWVVSIEFQLIRVHYQTQSSHENPCNIEHLIRVYNMFINVVEKLMEIPNKGVESVAWLQCLVARVLHWNYVHGKID
jgi:hypothetical protein